MEYDLLFSFPQIKDITNVEKQTLIAYFDGIDSIANGPLKLHILKRLEDIVWDLIWGLDDMTIYGLVDMLQQSSVAIWVLNNKMLPDIEWLINNFLDYWIEDPNRMREPLNTAETNGNFHEAIGNAGFRFINKYAIYAVEKMKNNK